MEGILTADAAATTDCLNATYNGKSTHDLIEANLNVLNQEFASTKELRFIVRAMSNFNVIRAAMTKEKASFIIEEVEKQLSRFVNSSSTVAQIAKTLNLVRASPPNGCIQAATWNESATVQIECYICLLLAANCLNNEAWQTAADFTRQTLAYFRTFSASAHLDPMLAKLVALNFRANEALGHVDILLNDLLAHLKIATLHHQVETQMVLINLVLRSYLLCNLHDLAEKFIGKVQLPTSTVSLDANQIAKYLFYVAKVNAVRLNYTQAFLDASLAVKKAPSLGADAFKIAATKLQILVQLLIGEIPEKSTFKEHFCALVPYYALCVSVRNGDVAAYHKACEDFKQVFVADRLLSLVRRLRHSVIKAALKGMSKAYSRISLDDVCNKLLLPSIKDAVYIVMKGIKDGVIDAFIDFERGFVQSNEVFDVYSTAEPLAVFDKRISYATSCRQESVKAMRFGSKNRDPLSRLQSDAAANSTSEIELAMGGGDDDDDDAMVF